MSLIGLKQALITKQKHCPTQLFVLHHYSEAKPRDFIMRFFFSTLIISISVDMFGCLSVYMYVCSVQCSVNTMAISMKLGW